jgi:hypothetical protein
MSPRVGESKAKAFEEMPSFLGSLIESHLAKLHMRKTVACLGGQNMVWKHEVVSRSSRQMLFVDGATPTSDATPQSIQHSAESLAPALPANQAFCGGWVDENPG